MPYGCADTVAKALQCMNPGIDQSPAEWRGRVREVAGAEGASSRSSQSGTGPPTRALFRAIGKSWLSNGPQFMASRLLPRASSAMDRSREEFFTDGAGAVRVESVLIEGLTHAFPIRTGGGSACGQPGDFVVPAEVCAATEIARFWGMPGSK